MFQSRMTKGAISFVSRNLIMIYFRMKFCILFPFNAMFVVFIRCASLSKYQCYHTYNHKALIEYLSQYVSQIKNIMFAFLLYLISQLDNLRNGHPIINTR